MGRSYHGHGAWREQRRLLEAPRRRNSPKLGMDHLGMIIGEAGIDWVWHSCNQPHLYFNTLLNTAGSILFHGFLTACIAVQKRWLSVRLAGAPPNSSYAHIFDLPWSQRSLHVDLNIRNGTLSYWWLSALSSAAGCGKSTHTAAAASALPTSPELVLTHVWKQKSKKWMQVRPAGKAPAAARPTPLRDTSATLQQPKQQQNSYRQHVWCADGKKITLKPAMTTQANEGSRFLQEMGLSIQAQCQTWDLLWERGKPRQVSHFLWQMLTNNLENCPRGSSSRKCARCVMCTQHAVVTIRHCLYDCPKAKAVWARMLRFRQHLGITEPLSWRRILLGSTEVLKIHKLIKIASCTTPSTSGPQQHGRIRRRLAFAAPTYLWELTRAFTLWHIWVARRDFVCHRREFPVNVIVLRIWDELLSSAKLVQKDIFENSLTQQSEVVQHLNDIFGYCYHFQNTLFTRDSKGNVQWNAEPPLWVLHD